MSFLAPALPALVSAGGGLLGGLFGGSSGSAPTVTATLPAFSAGGLVARPGDSGNYVVTPTAERTAQVTGLANTFGRQTGDIADLRSQFTPGASALRQAQLAALNTNRMQGLGNLRDNLAQRRILGSSFAQNSLAAADRQYQDQISQTMANTFLQELAANQGLIQQQYAAARGQYSTALDEMNLEASIAQNLTTKASDALNSAAKTQAELDAKAAAGSGQFFGNIGTQFGNALGGLFKGGSSGGSPLNLSSTSFGLGLY